jgi:hypothetical protein
MNNLDGSIWYFENDAEGKGLSFGFAAANSARHLGKELKRILEKEHERLYSRK